MNVQCDRCGTGQEIREDDVSLPTQCQRCGHVFIPQSAGAASDEDTIVLEADDSDIFALSDSFERDERIERSPGPGPQDDAASLGDMLFLGAEPPPPTGPYSSMPDVPGFEKTFDHSQHPDFDPTNPRSDALRLPGSPVTRPFEQPPPPPPAAPIALARNILNPSSAIPSTMVTEPPPEPTKAGLVTNAVISLIALIALLAGFVRVAFDLEPPADRQRVEKLTEALTSQNPQHSNIAGLHLGGVQATLYPQPSGKKVLVVYGSLSSSMAEPSQNIQVSTVLVNEQGNELATAAAPVGLVLTPFELAHIGPELSLEAIVAGRPPESVGTAAALSETDWMTIFETPPAGPSELGYRVTIERAPPMMPPEESEEGEPESTEEPVEQPTP